MYLLGYDIGSSSIKVALVEASSGETVKLMQHPKSELTIIANHADWAEQHPETWWNSVCQATKELLQETQIDPSKINGIGIAYQMHGLVCIDENQAVLRPSIIWCDSRAVSIGNKAFSEIGEEKCLNHFLNSPGNFTASKLKWVKENEPEIYSQIDKIMLPGDYIAMKLTGNTRTTVSGLSEGIFWDFKENKLAEILLNHYGISVNLLPEITGTFEDSGKLTEKAAQETGLVAGIPITYRAGDQPNNALSLGVFNPNEVAATGGTSGVIYGIVDQPKYDLQSRINPFAHVNHTSDNPRLGLLLCINGAGIQYAWLKNQMAESGTSFVEMGEMANTIPIGSDGLRIIPFGNGAERILCNENPGAQINNLQFNRHKQAHFYRAGLEGIAFSFVYGFQILKDLGLNPKVIKVGNDNLFKSNIFSQTIANLLNCEIEVVKTTGAVGAAKASGIGAGVYQNLEEAMTHNENENRFLPEKEITSYQEAYEAWEKDLIKLVTTKE
ncbi:MAG: FGGY family carbohydrate kinase [Bacteroidetes bacterium]|jgi:xylulokinase|nr:FGGY family carbohydrate kinase [Bacteroidota bacterium]MDF1864100.1 FGGY family carbohydrate kinase [Saprospiraceae bacterium]